MKLKDQPAAVKHLFRQIGGDGHYTLEERDSGRILLLFDNTRIGGWVDDHHGPHWYILQNNETLGLHPSYRHIVEHFGFSQIADRKRRYWRVYGAERMWAFKRAVEEITGVPLVGSSHDA